MAIVMKDFLYKVFLKQISMASYAKYLLVAMSLIGLFSVVASGQSGSSAVQGTTTSALCTVFNTVRNIIFLLGLTLMILGGALYAGANIMPGNSKGSFQGYGMSMIIGGVIGVAIAVAAPFVLNLVVSAGGSAGSTVVGTSGSSTISTLCSTT
jgi:hypothetical protein